MLLFFKENKALVIGLVILTIGRFAISGSGYLEDSDEVDYYAAELAFDAITHFEIREFANHVAFTEGKPTETLIKTVLVPFHRLWAFVINQPRYNSKSLMFLGVYNILVSLLSLGLFYLILRRLKVDKNLAAFGVLMLGILINFNVYTRHLLSYDLGLFFHLLALYFVLDEKMDDKKKFAWLGLTCAIGFTVYHGYFMFVALILAYVWWDSKANNINFWSRLKRFSIYFAILPIFFEVFFWLGGNSFIKESLKISGSIGQGSFHEGFAYAWLYLKTVEGYYGLVLLGLFLFGFVWAVSRTRKEAIEKLIVLSLATYFVFAFAVNILRMFVFYGRIFHMYIPFMVIGVVYLFQQISWKKRDVIFAGLALVLCVQYYFNIQEMNSFTYPKKLYEKYWALDTPSRTMEFATELDYTDNYLNIIEKITDSNENALEMGSYKFVNTCFFQHHPDRFIKTYEPFDLEDKEIVFSAPHFMSHPIYTFEYCSNVGRAFYLEQKFQLLVCKENGSN